MDSALPGHHVHTVHDITKLEKVRCRAARYIFDDYSSFDNVSAMLNQINWPSLIIHRLPKDYHVLQNN